MLHVNTDLVTEVRDKRVERGHSSLGNTNSEKPGQGTKPGGAIYF